MSHDCVQPPLTCTRTSARLVCVCQGTTSTVILSVVFVNVGQCGWSSGAQAPCDDMLQPCKNTMIVLTKFGYLSFS